MQVGEWLTGEGAGLSGPLAEVGITRQQAKIINVRQALPPQIPPTQPQMT